MPQYNTFQKFGHKANVLARLEFQLAFYNVEVQYVSYFAIKDFPGNIILLS